MPPGRPSWPGRRPAGTRKRRPGTTPAGGPDPAATRSALTRLEAPVLLLTGEYDVGLPPKRAAEYAGLFPRGELAVQPGGGHYPWLDDPESFGQTLAAFLR
ncbi:alpha/beta hydrolase [Micromonospora purpureochromogenes]